MNKKLLSMCAGLLLIGSQAFAYEAGDYVYTRTARFQIGAEAENLVVNGDFSETDYTSSSFGWTDTDGANLGTYMTIEPSAGPNGENVIYSVSTSGSMMQAVPFSTGKQYVITMQVKGPDAAVTYYGSSSSSNFIDVYAVKDAAGDQDDDNNYQAIASYDAIFTTWNEISFSFADESGEDGYIVILVKSLTAETLIGNFEVWEATQVGDDREVRTLLEDSQMLIESGQFPNDDNGFAEAVEEIYYLTLEDETAWDDLDNTTSLVDELTDMREIWYDENSSSMEDYFSKFDPYSMSKWNPGSDGSSYCGDWVLTGANSARWGHSSGAYYIRYEYSAAYTLGWGQATLTQTDMPAGTYLFALNLYTTKYERGYDYAGSNSYYIPNYSNFITGGYIFFNNDTTFIDTLDNYSGKDYFVIGTLEEGDTLQAGAYFPGFDSGGGVFRVGYPVMRLIGVTAEDAANQVYLESIATQQAALLAQIEAATAELNTLPWGNDTLQTTITTYTAYYNTSLLYVTVDGELVDGITFDDIPEDYDETLEDYEDAVSSVRSYYSSLNEPYEDLIELVATAQSYLEDESMSGASSSTRSTLQTEIDESNALIAGVTSTEQTDEFEAAYDELSDAIQAFRFSCASYLNPGEVEYTNNTFQLLSSSGWDVTGSSYWKYSSDSGFTDGYKAYIWRGYSVGEKGKIRREIDITEPGVYQFYFESYAFNDYESYYNALWNGLTGEDSVRSANIKGFFGLVDESETVDVLSHQENFNSSWTAPDEYRPFVILYTKTTDSSVTETLEFGYDALSNGYDDDGESLGGYCNSYAFSSTHIYYFGSEETYADGIAAAKAEEIQADDYVYSLSGVRVGKASDSLPKGIYVAKGKKFIVK